MDVVTDGDEWQLTGSYLKYVQDDSKNLFRKQQTVYHNYASIGQYSFSSQGKKRLSLNLCQRSV